MKKIILLLLSISLIYNVNAQLVSVSASCNSITCTNAPSYAGNLWGINIGWTGNSCSRVIVPGMGGTMQQWKARFFLERQNSNGTFTNLSGASGQYGNPTFTNVIHGIYRIGIEVPNYWFTYCGSNYQAISCYNSSGQFIGYWGQWSTHIDYSDPIVVGAITQSDNQYNFVDKQGTNTNSAGFDANEHVFISTSNLKNYNSYFLSVIELGGQQRYVSSNWVNSKLPTGDFDLTNFWASAFPNAPFVSLQSYKMQLVCTNQFCSTWNVNEQSFFICPSGSGCKRSDFTINNVISLSTKPNGFIINNLDFSTSNNYDILIHSIDGKLISKLTNITNNNITLNNVINGMYIVTTYNNRKKIHTDKLLINN
jgi:hypothetical protein